MSDEELLKQAEAVFMQDSQPNEAQVQGAIAASLLVIARNSVEKTYEFAVPDCPHCSTPPPLHADGCPNKW